LINAKAKPVFRNQEVEKLMEKLSELQFKCDKFNQSLDSGIDRVQEHCNTLRNQVYLRAEIMIEKIHQMNESLVAEIGEYEQACIRSCREKIVKDGKSDDSAQLVNEVDEFCKDKSKYLSEFKIDSKVIKKALEETVIHFDRLDVETINLKAIEFDGKLLNFKANTDNDELDHSFLGKLEYEVIKSIPKGLNIVCLLHFLFLYNLGSNSNL
jgi:hypothetical protein